MASPQVHRVFADGVKNQHKDGPQLCSLEVVGDELLVKKIAAASTPPPLTSINDSASNASTSLARASSATKSAGILPGQPAQPPRLLAKLNLTTLFHRTDPLLLVQLNENALVVHRKSEEGNDGLLLLFEEAAALNMFMESVATFTRDRKQELSRGTGLKGDSAASRSSADLRATPFNSAVGSSAGIPLTKEALAASALQERSRRQPSASPKRHPPAAAGRAQHRPEWDTTPAGVHRTPKTPHATTLFNSPSPVMPSASVTPAHRGGAARLGSVEPSPMAEVHRGASTASAANGNILGSQAKSSTHHNNPVVATPLAASNMMSPSAAYYSTSPFYRSNFSTEGDALRQQPLATNASPYPHHINASSSQQQQQRRYPSASYHSAASSGATGFSRTTATHLDAYLDRSTRIQHYMDTLDQSTAERERLLEDLFDERDRKRRAYLRQIEYVAEDDHIKSTVHDRFSKSKPNSFLSPTRALASDAPAPDGPTRSGAYHQPSPLPRGPPLSARSAHTASLSLEQHELVNRLRGMLAEIPDDEPIPHVESQVSSLPREDASLVDEIKRLLAMESEFEALKYEGEVQQHSNPPSASLGIAAGSHRSPPPATSEDRLRTSQPHLRAATDDDLQDAVAAEARLLSTLRYGTTPIPKPRPDGPPVVVSAARMAPTQVEAAPSPLRAPVDMTSQHVATHAPLHSPASGGGLGATSGGVSPLTPLSPQFNSPIGGHGDAIASHSTKEVPRTHLALDAPQPQRQTAQVVAEVKQQAASPSVSSSKETGAVLSAWKEVRDPNSGKVYYVNKETNKTTWKRAETDLDGPGSPLPAAGHQSTATAAQSPGIGWTVKQDPATGKPFYFNKATNKTTWKLADTIDSSSPATSHGGGVKSNVSSVGAAPAAAASPTTASPLGWVTKQDPTSGKVFFSNASLKKTTWKIEETDLQGLTAATPISPPSANVAGSGGPSAAGWVATKDPAGKTYYSNRVLKKTTWKIEETDLGPAATTPAAAAVVVQDLAAAAPLPPNWRTVADKNTGKTYFVNTVTSKTQWTRPTE